MYEMYLNGLNCEQICLAHGNQFPLGAILDAKQRLSWDSKREAQLANIHLQVERKVYKVKHDAMSTLSDLLGVAHKVWAEKIAKYLETGDSEALGGFDPSNLKNYKEIVTMLSALSENKNEPSKKEVMVGGTVKHVHAVTDSKDKKIKSAAASDLLDLISTKDS
jgi:hypothetical protein